jgi:cytochrome c oxidase subunit 2
MTGAQREGVVVVHILRLLVLDGRFRRLLLALPLALAGAMLAAPAAQAGLLFPEAGGSPNADSIRTLYIMVFVLALFIFAGVEGTLLWSMWRYRARKGRTAAQIHGNTKLEIGWTVGAFLILIFITAFTFIKLPAIKDPKESEPGITLASTDMKALEGEHLRIVVDGQQYVWRYLYPGQERLLTYTDMYVPVGVTVVLDIQADDVVHSWWIPKLGGKMDAVPGYTNKTWFRIPADAIPEGEDRVVYTGQCAELCGRNHANMYARVIGLRPEDYKRWYQNQVEALKQAREGAAAQQEALTEQEGGAPAAQDDEGQ